MEKTDFNQTVIITGASSGVGKATARHFANNGANLVLVARGQERLDQVSKELKNITRVMSVSMDVSNFSDCENLINKTLEEFSSIDVLINNAGYHKRGLVEESDPKELGRMIDVNLKAPIILSRLVISHMNNNNCAIINVASLAGRTPVPGSAVYSSSKFGLRAFTYALATERKEKNIKIAVVSPGPIDTPFIMDDIDSVSDLTFSQSISSIDAVAEAILELCINDKIEQAMPKISGFLTNMSYLFPRFGLLVMPLLERKGRRVKKKLKHLIEIKNNKKL
jgi:short-subunit dehydrogenase